MKEVFRLCTFLCLQITEVSEPGLTSRLRFWRSPVHPTTSAPLCQLSGAVVLISVEDLLVNGPDTIFGDCLFSVGFALPQVYADVIL